MIKIYSSHSHDNKPLLLLYPLPVYTHNLVLNC